MRKKTFFSIIFFSLLTLIVVITLLLFKINSLPKHHLIIAEANQPAFGLIYLADKLNYFKKHNLDVQFKKFPIGRDALNAVIKGEADLATTYETPIIIKTYEGIKLSIISSLHTTKRETGLVVKKSSNIKSLEDLKNKRIALIKGTNLEFFLYLLLLQSSLKPSDLDIVNVNANQLNTVLDNPEIDGVVTWSINLYRTKQKYANKVTTFYSDLYMESSALVGSTQTINSKAEAVTDFLKALNDAELFKNKYPKKSIELVASYFNQEDITNYLRLNWNNYRFQIRLTNSMLNYYEFIGLWLKETGLYKDKSYDFRQIMNTKFLYNVEPDYVTLN